MTKALVIVESPAKARTIGSILGKGYVVESSLGHIRDLPRNAGEIPAAFRQEAWSNLGVDVENGFKPLYVVPAERRKHVARLRDALKQASELYLATDEDREGESIAWHLTEVLNPRVPVRRMVFHEITRRAIEEAVRAPRDIDRRLVDAQEARRVLDRLFGYEVSPVLWRRVMPGLSAGRVQSVATRLLVERERARMRFRRATFWDVEGRFRAQRGELGATLVSVDGVRLATGKDFDPNGVARADVRVLDEGAARSLADALGGSAFGVRSVEEKPWRRSPHPPFMTSTLQQEAGRKLRYSAHRTMQVAQRLYENGYITYMRTDSVTLSETALAAARAQAAEMFGREMVPDRPRVYTSRVKNAQEAHEAIRPAGDSFRTPEEVSGELQRDEFRLYELIWMRTLASQMADARGMSLQVRLGATSARGEDAEFAASGRTITFPGFLRAYVEGADDPEAELEDQEVLLPPLAEGDALGVVALEPKGHETQPPPRYTEASLVRALEELGIGRPSTYASILETIAQRGYVFKKGSALVPSFTAFAVVGLLEQYFEHLVDYGFTARMEDELDAIAAGEGESGPYLSRFYFGNGQTGLRDLIKTRLDEIDAREVSTIPLGTDAEGREIAARVGRYGPYVQRGEDRASVPEDLPPDELTVEKAVELLDAPSHDRALGADPASGEAVMLRSGRFGPYVQLGEGNGDPKPRTASLFASMSPETVTLEEALRLLSLPRVVGAAPDGDEITAQSGRYGPYVKKGEKETRSLESEEQIFTVTLEQALELLAQPRRRRGQRASAAPLRELGADPATGKPVVLRDGRYGPYVTDGETNASLPRAEDATALTLERALELLQARRGKGPKRPPRRRKKRE